MAVAVPPPTAWAQRKDVVYVTFRLSDVSNPDISIAESSLSFSATGGDNKHYAVTFELYESILPEDSKKRISPFEVSVILKKKNADSPYWPRLRKEKAKAHFLKVDFDKWRDSDDSDDGGLDEGGFDAMANMGMQGGAMGGMEDFDDSDDDSDADAMPDLESSPAGDADGSEEKPAEANGSATTDEPATTVEPVTMVEPATMVEPVTMDEPAAMDEPATAESGAGDT